MFIEWFPTKLGLLFQKRVFPYYIWILIMSPLRTKGDIYCLSDLLLPLLSEACPEHNIFVFRDRSMIFGMWVLVHKAVCRIP